MGLKEDNAALQEKLEAAEKLAADAAEQANALRTAEVARLAEAEEAERLEAAEAEAQEAADLEALGPMVRVKLRLHSPDAHLHMAGGKIRSGSVIEIPQSLRDTLGDKCHPTDEELNIVPLKLQPHQFGFAEQQEAARRARG